jgi:flagellar basal body-associated protein FliL
MSKLLILALTILVLPVIFFILVGVGILFVLFKIGILNKSSFGYKVFSQKVSQKSRQAQSSSSSSPHRILLNCRHQTLEQNEYGMVCLDCQKIIQHN